MTDISQISCLLNKTGHLPRICHKLNAHFYKKSVSDKKEEELSVFLVWLDELNHKKVSKKLGIKLSRAYGKADRGWEIIWSDIKTTANVPDDYIPFSKNWDDDTWGENYQYIRKNRKLLVKMNKRKMKNAVRKRLEKIQQRRDLYENGEDS